MSAVPRALAGPCARWPEDSDFVREVLERAGDKWSTLVVATLEDGPLRYTDIHHSIPGISQRMLTLTLRHLRRDGLITRTSYPEVPPRVEYALTPLGSSLLATVLALAAWAVDHHVEIRRNRARFDAAGE
ncbi:HxlR family transcriptional regulator [Acrocarpospora phusangensis]|uniref:HxlR family transcriptional regulator n=1 Tax=Acrocarpospora phusangensis TaxID=1070424 RepID=A0A919QFY1_9ACTN|nr:helix-turn-helix domain-containing protein [Acrocarpospora phusangensis]GIH25735.1 HxlR family transcriptional regulator [Acrocarpospora phusangensis]